MARLENYKDAYNILGLNPESASLKEISEKIYNLNREIKFKDVLDSTAYTKTNDLNDMEKAFNYLKDANPLTDDISYKRIINAHNNNKSEWSEFYEKYHIHFEQQIQDYKLKHKFFVVFDVLMATNLIALFYIIIKDAPDSHKDIIAKTIFALSSSVMSAVILGFQKNYKNKSNSEILNIFKKMREINDLKKKITTIEKGK